MRVDRVVVRLLAGVLCLAAVAACRPGPGPHPGTSRPQPSTMLIQWDEDGGHCMETCPEEHYIVNANGSWVATKGAVATTGQLSDTALRDVTQQVRTGLESLRRLAPSSGCPSAYDGRDIEITYSVDARTTTVSNCTKDFGDNALIAYTGDLVDTFT
jgi:hypothetical protein